MLLLGCNSVACLTTSGLILLLREDRSRDCQGKQRGDEDRTALARFHIGVLGTGWFVFETSLLVMAYAARAAPEASTPIAEA